MQIAEGKAKFIESWGTMASEWGINRSMAQVHALLLISPQPLTTDDIMAELSIARGNANMNVRSLVDWELVYKKHQPGERKEYFLAEKDIWKVVTRIITQRKRRELEPLLQVLDEVSAVEGTQPDEQEFAKVVRDIKVLAHRANQTLESFAKADSNWLTGMFLYMMR
jgi:DNA-binding transcriptional regulator GbsR (MarR family)